MAQPGNLYTKYSDDFFDGIKLLSETELRQLVREAFEAERQPTVSFSLFQALGELDFGIYDGRVNKLNVFVDAVTQYWCGLDANGGYQSPSHLAALAAAILNNPEIQTNIRDAFRTKIEEQIIVARDDEIDMGIKKSSANRLIYLFCISAAHTSVAYWGNELAVKTTEGIFASNRTVAESYIKTQETLIKRAAAAGWDVGPLREELSELKQKATGEQFTTS